MGQACASAIRWARSPRHLAFLALLVPFVLLAGCSEDDVERGLGKMASGQVERSFRVENDPLVCDWVKDVGMKEAEASRRGPEKVPPDFKVLDSEIVNAMAVPWGHVYVTTGLLEAAESDDEVAAVVGHEWGHVEHRHSIKAFKKGLIWSTIAQFALAKQTAMVQDVGVLGLNLGLLKSSRGDELQADRDGVELPYRTGYDPQGQVTFFQKLIEERKRKPSRLEVYFMTHPALETRIGKIEERPELDANNAEALTTIGQGYLARYRVAEAIDRLEKAVKLADGSFQAHRSLGDAYRLDGDTTKAAEQYRAALKIKGDDQETKERLASLRPTPAPMLDPLPAQDVREAEAAASDATDALQTIAATRVTVEKHVEATKGDLKEAQTSAIGALHDLDTLYGTAVGHNDAIDEMVVAADTAVQQANEAVYGVESMHAQMQDAVERASATVRAARARLQRAVATGQASAGEVERLTEAVAESKRAMLELADAAADGVAAVDAAKNASRVATNTLSMLDQFTYQRPRGIAMRINLDAIENARQRGSDANAKVAKAKKGAAAARARTLLAQIDVATAGATPQETHVYDGLVAYYMRSDPDAVAKLREKGYGYGDIALALAHSKRDAEESPEYIAEHGRGMSQSLVDYMKEQKASLRNANIFLTFLANAIEKQQPEGEGVRGAPSASKPKGPGSQSLRDVGTEGR
jgi:Zn-dependent protease with chaperone function